MGYSFRLIARVLLYAPSHRQDSTYHSLCYTSRGAMAGTRNSSMGPPYEGSIRRPIAPWANALTTELHLAPFLKWYIHLWLPNYRVFHEIFRTFIANFITLPGHRNKRKSVFKKKYKIIEQEMNKMAIHTHVIFIPHNTMSSLFISCSIIL